VKNKRLGKGLDALIKNTAGPAAAAHPDEAIAMVAVKSISPNPFQPRTEFSRDALDELKDSIREKGIIQPVTIRKGDNGGYQLIAGERRLRAVQELGISEIPAYIIHVDSDEEMLEMAIIENVQREKLNPIELANSYQRLIHECKLTQEQVAQKIGKERSTVTNILRLLKLDDAIKNSLVTDAISMGHARALLAVDSLAEQKRLLQKTTTEGWSVRKLESIVKQADGDKAKDKPKPTPVKKTVHHRKVEDMFRDAFGTQVRLYPKKQGGAIEIEYYSGEDLNRIIEIINSINY
jgi:ParB family chromosome partitioning protein